MQELRKPSTKVVSLLLSLVMILSLFTIIPVTTANATVSLSGTTLTLSGTVTLAELTGYSKKTTVKTITASSGTKFTAASTKEMFKGFSNCTSINLSKVSFSSSVDATSMFYGLTKLTSLTLPSMTVKNANNMFYNCSALTTLNLSNMNTSSCTSMAGMFYGCSKLSSITTGTTFTSTKVTTMQTMFYGCSSLTTLNLSKFNTSKCDMMASMFKGCSKLKTLTLSTGFTGGISSISGLFDGCSSLEAVDVSHIVTYSGTIMTNVFRNCALLTELDLSGFQDSSYEGASAGMFSGCTGLDRITISDGFSITEDMLLTNAKDDNTGWANEEDTGTIVSADGEYAVFSGAGSYVRSAGSAPETYTVTWKNWDNTVLETDEDVAYGTTPEYNGDIPTKASDAQYRYTFSGWNPALTDVAEDAVYTAVFTASEREYYTGHSLSLNGDIAVNFYLDLSEEEVQNATINFSWFDKELENAQIILDPKGSGYYRASCPIAVAEMTYPITAALTVGGKDYTDTYSAVTYANVILTDESFKTKFIAEKGTEKYNQLVVLVKSMLDYGAKAQKQFKRDEDNLANQNLVSDDEVSPYYYVPGDVTADMISTEATDMSAADYSDYGLEYTGSTIVYLSQTSIRHYFEITNPTEFEKNSGSITFNGEKVEYTVKGDEIYFELKNISAPNLDTLYALSINGTEYQYSVLDYVKACLNSTATSTDMKALAATTYRYNQAANTYFG